MKQHHAGLRSCAHPTTTVSQPAEFRPDLHKRCVRKAFRPVFVAEYANRKRLRQGKVCRRRKTLTFKLHAFCLIHI